MTTRQATRQDWRVRRRKALKAPARASTAEVNVKESAGPSAAAAVKPHIIPPEMPPAAAILAHIQAMLHDPSCDELADVTSLRVLLESYDVVRRGMLCDGQDHGTRPIHLVLVVRQLHQLVPALLERRNRVAICRLVRFTIAAARAHLVEYRAARNMTVAIVESGVIDDRDTSLAWLRTVAPPATATTSSPRSNGRIDGFRAHCGGAEARGGGLRSLADSLLKDGVAVSHEALPDRALLMEAAAEARAMHAAGLLAPSTVKNVDKNGQRKYYNDASARGDVVRWLDGTDARCPACSALTQWLRGELLEAVKAACDHAPAGGCAASGRAPRLCLQGAETLPIAMLACYPGGGARFQRHVDNSPEARDQRVCTAILYLQPEWQESDGGILRIDVGTAEDAASPSARTLDVPPRLGTLVLFWSHRVPHEVLPAATPRFALSLWMLVDPARQPDGWLCGSANDEPPCL